MLWEGEGEGEGQGEGEGEEPVSQEEALLSSDKFSDHLSGQTRARTMMGQ